MSGLPDYSSLSRARVLNDELRLRAQRFTPPLPVTQSQDASGNPLLIVGSVSAPGTAGVTIRLRPIDWPLVQDAIGLPQKVYTPHVSEMIYEAGVVLNTLELTSTVTLMLGMLGTRVDVYQTANGTAADFNKFIPANFQVSFQPSLTSGIIGSV